MLGKWSSISPPANSNPNGSEWLGCNPVLVVNMSFDCLAVGSDWPVLPLRPVITGAVARRGSMCDRGR